MDLSIRNLFEHIIEYEDNMLCNDILIPWLKNNNCEEYLRDIERKISQNINVLEEDSWELYALSRVLDILTLRFQTDNNADGSDWFGPNLRLEEYEYFIKMLGLTTMNPITYNPFYCEIVEATEGDDNFTILENYHPSILLGNLLIKRAGVKVCLNPKEYNLKIINQSTLYWTYRRKNRKCSDLSQGWGSNSQWRTQFRLDFDLGNILVYNSEGQIDLNMPNEETFSLLKEDNLTLEEAIELTVNRHFITSEKPDNDLFPYDYKYTLNTIDSF